MSTVSEIIKRNAFAAAAGLIAFAAIMPAIVLSQMTSAALITSRAIKMSSSTKAATSVTYGITFTTATAAILQSVAIDFCDENPIIGSSTCTLPSGMVVGSSGLSTTNLPTGQGAWSASVINSSHTLLISNAANTTSVAASTAVTISVSGFTNQTAADTFYGRILTFTTNATGYTSGTPGSYTDAGGAAMSTTDAVAVTATVAESLQFCVSAANPGADCAGATTPAITLGHGGPPALIDTTAVDTTPVYFQVSTNASGTTTVRAKGSANLTSGSSTIAGAGDTAIAFTAGMAGGRFGMRVSSGSGTSGSTTSQAPYNNGTDYALDSTTGGGTGDNVTGTYGDTLVTGTGVMEDVESILTFAATAGATTPAGVYTASYSLIATPAY